MGIVCDAEPQTVLMTLKRLEAGCCAVVFVSIHPELPLQRSRSTCDFGPQEISQSFHHSFIICFFHIPFSPSPRLLSILHLASEIICPRRIDFASVTWSQAHTLQRSFRRRLRSRPVAIQHRLTTAYTNVEEVQTAATCTRASEQSAGCWSD